MNKLVRERNVVYVVKTGVIFAFDFKANVVIFVRSGVEKCSSSQPQMEKIQKKLVKTVI